MNKIEWDTENGVLDENDLWKLFSDHPDQPSETILFFCDLKPLLKPLKLEDESRLYHLFSHSTVPAPPGDACWRATVTQKNLRRVAAAMATAGVCQDVAVQYLGANPNTVCLKPNPEECSRKQQTDVKKRRGKPKPKVKNDSVNKIVTSYFALLTPESFEYGTMTYEPRDVTVSPLILRGYTCPPGCGGCCRKWSLDYIAPDGVPAGHPLTKRVVEFDGREVEVWSDLQVDRKDKWCRNLRLDDGRCNIHGFQPFSCDFELLRSIMYKDSPRARFTQQLYGRPWAMARVDGESGALCEMTEPSPETIADVDRRLARLEMWMKHFGLNPSRVRMIRDELPEIAKSGKAFSITERENQMRLEGGELYAQE